MATSKKLVVRRAAGANADLLLKVGGASVVLTVKPFTLALQEQAEWAARAAVADTALADTEAPEADKKSRPFERGGIFYSAFIVELGRAAIVAWDVVDETGMPVPCDPETVAQVLSVNVDLALAFDKAYGATKTVRANEGNVSGPAPSGISATGPTTADPAPATPIAPNVPI
jgi:hypothetical protein